MVLGLTTSNEIKIKVTADKDCKQTVSVEWPVEKVKETLEQAFVSVQGEAKIPGFRPGKTPLDLIKKNFKDAAYARAQDILLREGVSEAIKSKKINAVQSPVVQNLNFQPDKVFQFEFQVEVAPKFKVTGYKGLKLTKTDKPIGDEELQKALANLADMNARLVESKAEVLDNTQFAVIDYEGFLESKPLPGAKAENFLLDMSAPQAIAGLAEGLKGMKSGEEKDVPVTFPGDSPAKDLAGKQAHFKVKLQAIKEKSVPAMDDEFAKDLGVSSLEELKKRLRENLDAEAKTKAKRELENQIVEKLLAENVFALPAGLVEQQSKHLVERQKNRWLRQGIGPQDQVKLLEAAQAELAKQAEKDIRLAYVMEAIAESEKISASAEEVQARVQLIMSQTDPKEKAAMEKALQGEYRGRIENEIREDKVFDFIINQAKFK